MDGALVQALVAAAAGLAVFGLAYGARVVLNPERTARDRVADLTARPGDAARRAQQPSPVGSVAAKVGALARPQDAGELETQRRQLLQAGYRSANALEVFNGLRVVLLLVLALIGFLLTRQAAAIYIALGVMAGAAAGYYLPGVWVRSALEGRQASLMRSFPDALDLLVSSVEAGLGLDAAFRRVAKELEGPAPEGLELRLDGRPMAVQSLGTPLPLDPGPHSLVARAPGHVRGESPFVVAAGPSAATVVIAGLAAEAPARAEAPQGSVQAPPAPSAGGRRVPWPAMVSGAVGLAGVGVGTIFGIQAIRAKSDVDASCRGTACSAAGLAANDDARSAAALSTVGFAVGVAGVVGAFVLLVVRQPDDPAPPRPTSSLGFGGPGGPAGLSYSGAF